MLPRDEDDRHDWRFPRNGGGLSEAKDSEIEKIREMLADNMKVSLAHSGGKRAVRKIREARGDIETAYMRALCENFYGDLFWQRNREMTPYAVFFNSGVRADKTLRQLDSRVMHILQNGFCAPLRARSVPFVDAVLRPADESDMYAREFVAGGNRAFPMVKTRAAEETHQRIARELCRFLSATDFPRCISGALICPSALVAGY